MEIYFIIPILIASVALYALIAVYVERKVAAFIQDRLGPMEVGPKGILQTLADIIKLMLKEQIIPTAADAFIFRLAPVLIFASIFAGFAVIPFAPGVMGVDLQAGIFYVLSIVALDAIGLLLTGWGSNNKYAMLGAVRAVSQIIAYEIPVGASLLAGVICLGTLRINEMVVAQSLSSPQAIYFLGFWDVSAIGGVLGWNMFRYPHLIFVFIIYFIASLAECNRAPFDLPEAESELVGGFHTEYSGFGFAVLFLAEYANMLLLSLLAVCVFAGGWATPLPNIIPMAQGAEMSWIDQITHLQLGHLTSGDLKSGLSFGVVAWGIFWTLSKAITLILVQMWIRWTYPRLRPDQLMRLCWQYLTPAAFIGMIISAIWKVAEVYL